MQNSIIKQSKLLNTESLLSNYVDENLTTTKINTFTINSSDNNDKNKKKVSVEKNKLNNKIIEENNENTNNNTNLINNSCKNMIIYYGKEFLCILALILTAYATFQNVPPKTSRAPMPKPFFSKGSLVHDSPTGSLGQTQHRVSLSDLAFVLYYAPWCAESQYSRPSYEHVARLYYQEAHFAAINCWQPGGECRLQYSKVRSWPVLMAYLPSGLATQYHGQWTKSALSRFVKSLLTPMKRFINPEDLLKSTISCDAVVVAFIDMNYNKANYRAYYQTSVTWLEKDPFQEVTFGIVTGDSTKSFGVENTPTIRLYLWNETIEYYGNWSHTDINKWIIDNMLQVSSWIAPTGKKSMNFLPYLKQGPVLLLFTPRNLYSENIDAYDMIRQIGMEYYNCAQDDWVKEMTREYIPQQRKENYQSYLNLRTECKNLLKITKQMDSFEKCTKLRSQSSTVSTVTFVNVLNTSKSTDGNQKKYFKDFCEIGPKQDKSMYESCDGRGHYQHQQHHHQSTYDDEMCYKPEKQRKKLTKYEKEDLSQGDNEEDELLLKKHDYVTSMLNSDFDTKSPQQLQKNHLKKRCDLLNLSELDGHTLFFDYDDQDSLHTITGLSCNLNKTFSMMAIDSILYHTFAERLGIDLLNIENKTAAIILDHENESTYLLRERISLTTLTRFLKDYSTGNLLRYLRSNRVQYKYTHFFNNDDDMNIDINQILTTVNTNTNENNKIVKDFDFIEKQTTNFNNNNNNNNNNKVTSRIISIKEIFSENFEDIVIKSNKTIISLFHSSQCALCGLMSQSLLYVSNILKDLPNIEFVRIDGDKNDLSWFYTMEVFPSLVIFPSDRKIESRIFPNELKVNVKNVLGFILANLNRPMRIYAIILTCKNSKKLNFLDDCLIILRREITDNIFLSLREWRKFPHNRRHILRRLEILQQMYLQLLKINHSCDVNILEPKVKLLIKIWTNNCYQNNL